MILHRLSAEWRNTVDTVHVLIFLTWSFTHLIVESHHVRGVPIESEIQM